MKNRSSRHWNRLDNAAKIFPATTGKRDTKVFRLACELKEKVEPDILQEALGQTLVEFPLFYSVLKRGLFWYYLEEQPQEVLIKKEGKQPCSPLFDNNKKSLLFNVTYYKKRINVEVYHALTDGTGALQFLRALVYHYLMIKYDIQLKGKSIQMDYDASASQRMDDSFSRYYDDESKPSMIQSTKKKKKAYKLKGAKLSESRIQVIEGVISVKEVIQKAHDYHTTLTVFLVALLLSALREEMSVRDKKRWISVAVPVNLRKYFKSESARNFFGIMDIQYRCTDDKEEFSNVIEFVKNCFAQELSVDKLSARMHKLGSLERNIFARIIPLSMKDVSMKIAYELSELNYTFSLSNIGNVIMPEELRDYIRLFDVFVSTKKEQMCICSYEDNLNLSFTSCFISTEIQKRFFRKLTDMGIGVEIVTNRGWEEQ